SRRTTKTWSAAGMVVPVGLLGDGDGIGPAVLWFTPPQPSIASENDNNKMKAILQPMDPLLPSTALDAAELRDVVSCLKLFGKDCRQKKPALLKAGRFECSICVTGRIQPWSWRWLRPRACRLLLAYPGSTAAATGAGKRWWSGSRPSHAAQPGPSPLVRRHW